MSEAWPLILLCVAAYGLTNWGWLLLWRARGLALDWANQRCLLLQKNSGRWHNAFRVVSRDHGGEGRSSGEWPAAGMPEQALAKKRALMLADTMRLPKTPGMPGTLPLEPPRLSEAQTIELTDADLESEE